MKGKTLNHDSKYSKFLNKNLISFIFPFIFRFSFKVSFVLEFWNIKHKKRLFITEYHYFTLTQNYSKRYSKIIPNIPKDSRTIVICIRKVSSNKQLSIKKIKKKMRNFDKDSKNTPKRTPVPFVFWNIWNDSTHTLE